MAKVRVLSDSYLCVATVRRCAWKWLSPKEQLTFSFPLKYRSKANIWSKTTLKSKINLCVADSSMFSEFKSQLIA